MAIGRRNKNDQLSSEKIFRCTSNQEKANVSNKCHFFAHLTGQNF